MTAEQIARTFRTAATHGNITLAEFVEQMDGNPDDMTFAELIEQWCEARIEIAHHLTRLFEREGML